LFAELFSLTGFAHVDGSGPNTTCILTCLVLGYQSSSTLSFYLVQLLCYCSFRIIRDRINKWGLDFILTSCTVRAMNGGLWLYTGCSVHWSNFYIMGHYGKTHMYGESHSVSLLNPRFSLCSVRTDGFMTVVCASHCVISESVDWSSWNLVCHLSSKYWFLKITLFLNVTPCIFYQTITVHKLCYIISFICLLLRVSFMTYHHRGKTFQYISRNLQSFYMFCMSYWNYIRHLLLSILLVSIFTWNIYKMREIRALYGNLVGTY
jgi:hypothetical protein